MLLSYILGLVLKNHAHSYFEKKFPYRKMHLQDKIQWCAGLNKHAWGDINLMYFENTCEPNEESLKAVMMLVGTITL